MSNRNNDTDDVLNGYNPFAPKEPTKPSTAAPETRPNFSSVILPESQKPSRNPNDKVERELSERERELNDLESRINRREEELNKREGSLKDVKINNFPPMPHWFPCRPCFYQDCDVEIPEDYRLTVKCCFYIWIAYALLLFVNLFGSLSYLIVNSTSGDIGALFGVSILMFCLMPPLGYILWFRPLYRAFRSQSSINFFVFFLFFAIQVLIIIIQALGINVLGSCGWINSLVALKVNTGVSIFMIIIACGFTVLAFFSGFLYIKVHRTYRNTGASFSKAKAEMKSETMSAALHA